jgi:hypothetical protein
MGNPSPRRARSLQTVTNAPETIADALDGRILGCAPS